MTLFAHLRNVGSILLLGTLCWVLTTFLFTLASAELTILHRALCALHPAIPC